MHKVSKDYHYYIYLYNFELINTLIYFYHLIFKTTYIKLCIFLLKYIYKSKTRMKLHGKKLKKSKFKSV